MTARPSGRDLVGERYDVEVDRVAHGGHCVARLPEEVPEVGGTVVFVRHTAPGERVTVEVTEGRVGDRFLRADAVEVHRPSPDRVVPPCSYAGPGRCGGCDFQHLTVAAQRRLKGEVVAEQLRRLAGIHRDVVVEGVPGDDDGLRYRTRMRFHPAGEGRLGLRAHRSHRVVPVDDCLLQAPGAHVAVEGEPRSGNVLTEVVLGRRYDVAEDGFWQVHQGAPETLVTAVLEGAGVREGDRVVDLYCGVGLFTAPLAEAAGERGHVLAVEGDRAAVDHARANLASYPWVEVVRGPVARVLQRAPHDAVDTAVDVVVLDPPREGAKRAVVAQLAARRPRTVVHVACDPAAFGRDTALLAEAGYELAGLRAFDLFPMTQHVEVVGTFTRR
ncbi:class I SAM-dependent RNA methyltransferase [Nocardioides caldifontis]|uniref:class I SAM-dependent RNA methyltransferase n=1 Tax=Nocardioides caldifontis TaxID=2588938 RepID=UPI0011DFC4FD|nr:TRAM domain-containing protein [Nocardioides caldifontis]